MIKEIDFLNEFIQKKKDEFKKQALEAGYKFMIIKGVAINLEQLQEYYYISSMEGSIFHVIYEDGTRIDVKREYEDKDKVYLSDCDRC